MYKCVPQMFCEEINKISLNSMCYLFLGFEIILNLNNRAFPLIFINVLVIVL